MATVLPQPPILPRITRLEDVEAAFNTLLKYIETLRATIEPKLP